MIEVLLTSIKESLVKGEKVQIVGFGSFDVRKGLCVRVAIRKTRRR
ncbi:hypothetical protein FACS1894167_14460 [Synergistales bacterium]|nr:hypothetical protein FACS1894167_14460 [Synergistales bacterium]